MNNGAWNEIEEAHRAVVANPASGIKAIWVISGPIFNDGKPKTTVGKGIGVPDSCYKVIAWFDQQGKFNTRAYIIGQADTTKGAKNYLTTVDAVEAATGLNFFTELPDAEETRIEAETQKELWN